MGGFRVPCPAKLNLYLSVGAKDARGYHPIHTVFQAIELCDVLEVEKADEDTFSCDWPELPEDNTVTKAWRLLKEIAQVPPLRIRLSKTIPSESGLGGGSSDAAGLIRTINRFLPAPIADHHLMDVAAAVGADVPFFLVGGRAIGEGYGDRLTPLPDPPCEWYVVVRPPVGISTKEAYAKLDERPDDQSQAPDHENGAVLYNDFERVMPCDCDDWIERLLSHGAVGALLTGSGSAVFGRFSGERQATEAAVALHQEWVKSYRLERAIPVWVTRSSTRSESLRVESL